MIDSRFAPRDPHDPGPVPDGWVRVDFHMHTYASGDAVTTVDEFGSAVERAGLDVVCVTDHHAIHLARMLATELDVRVVVGEELKVNPGQTKVETYDLPAGTYSLICDIPGHKEAGMTATLTTS